MIAAVLGKQYLSVRPTIVDTVSDLEALVARKPDLVFLGMKFVPVDPALGRYDPAKIWLANYLAENGIAYTGSDHLAHQLAADKVLAKQHVQAAGLKTAPFHVITKDQARAGYPTKLSFPVFVKPTDRGGGQGIDSASVAYTSSDLQTKVRSIATNWQADSLIETYLPGREFSVAILKAEHSSGYLTMPIELIAPLDNHGARLLSSQVKSANTEQALAVSDPALRSSVIALALNVFNALGARDYGRIDIRLDAAGTAHFLEANLTPSLISGYGSFPKACALNYGLDHESMILTIVRLALLRLPNRAPPPSSAKPTPVPVLQPV